MYSAYGFQPRAQLGEAKGIEALPLAKSNLSNFCVIRLIYGN